MSDVDALVAGRESAEAAELERVLWLRSLLGDSVDLAPSEGLERSMRQRFFETGQFLYRQGTVSDRLFFVVRGKVVHSLAGSTLREFGPRDILGAIDAALSRPHAFDAVAKTDTVALELDHDEWLEFLEDNFEVTRDAILRVNRGLPPTSPPRPDLTQPTAHRRSRRRSMPTETENRRASLGPRLALSEVERLAVLRACPALEIAGLQAIARLSHFSETLFFAAGETLELSPAALYVVEVGRIRAVARNAEGLSWTEETTPGNAVAGLGLLEAGRFEVEIEVLEPSSLFRIPTERLFDVMEDHFSLARSLLAHLSAETESLALQERLPSSELTSRPRAARPDEPG